MFIRKMIVLKQEKIADLLRKKIFFGHNEIGYTLLEEIMRIIEKENINLNILETDEISGETPLIAHKKIGKDHFPFSKIEAFRDIIDKKLGKKLNIAFMKLSYIDITNNSNIEEIFSFYKKNIEFLKQKYPHLKFIHVTVPLTPVKNGLWGYIKIHIKQFLKKSLNGFDDNIKRTEFNMLLKQEYLGKDPLFDLAAIESTYPDGSKYIYQHKNCEYPALISEYAENSNYLSNKGKEIIGFRLLKFLTESLD